MTFQARITSGIDHERKFLNRVRRNGYLAYSWGQGVQEEAVRDVLKRTSSLARWLPDALVIHPFSWTVVWSDPKNGRDDTTNYLIEKRALELGRAWEAAIGDPVLYVWHDFRVSFCSDLNPTRTMPYRGNGSGTPAWLIDKATEAHSLPFDMVFDPDGLLGGTTR